MSNPAFADLIKIGRSERDPQEFRKSELETTGVPEPFRVEYMALVDNHQTIEKKLHQIFHNRRPNKNREFFTCSIEEAILEIRNVATLKYEVMEYVTTQEIELAQAKKLEQKKREEAARLQQIQENEVLLANLLREKRNEEQLSRLRQREARELRIKKFFKILKHPAFLVLAVVFLVWIGGDLIDWLTKNTPTQFAKLFFLFFGLLSFASCVVVFQFMLSRWGNSSEDDHLETTCRKCGKKQMLPKGWVLDAVCETCGKSLNQ